MQENENTNEMTNPDGTTDSNVSDVEQWQKQFEPVKQPYKSNSEKAKSFILLVLVAFLVIMVIYVYASSPKPYCPFSAPKTALGAMKAAVDAYSAKHNGDISSLDEPKGTLKEGFVEGSNLLKLLMLEPEAFSDMECFDAEDFSLEFVTDGKDGFYIAKMTATEGGGTTGEGPSGIITYNSKTQTWEEEH